MIGKSSNKDYHHGDLRNALLVVAEDLLRQRGVAGISLREVAKQAGVSHTAPYRHFRDKEQLLQALAAVGYSRLAAALQGIRDEYEKQPETALKKGGEAYVELAVSHPQLTQLMFGGVLSRDEVSPELAEFGDAAFNALLSLVDLGIAQKLYRIDDRMTIALAAWSMVHGLSMLVIAGQLGEYAGTKQAEQKMAQDVVDVLLHGLT